MPWSSSGRWTFNTLIGLVGGTALFWLLTITAWFVARRLGGAFRLPLSSTVLIGVAVSVSVLAIALAHSFNRITDRAARPAVRIAFAGLLVIALIGLGASMSLPGSGILGLAGAWATLSAAACWLLTRSGVALPSARLEHLAAPTRGQSGGMTSAALTDQASHDHGSDNSAELSVDEADAESFPVHVDQQWIRARDDAGQPYVEGTARIAIAAGQRTAHLHLAICPPLDHSPEVQVEQIDGPPAQVQVGMTLPQGIRVDVRRLASLDADESVIVAFFGK